MAYKQTPETERKLQVTGEVRRTIPIPVGLGQLYISGGATVPVFNPERGKVEALLCLFREAGQAPATMEQRRGP